jgi:Ankyrin repeats (3 copies)
MARNKGAKKQLLEDAKTGDRAADVKKYLDAGGSASVLIEASSDRGQLLVPLVHAMACGNAHAHRELAECIRLLVRAGADINAVVKVCQGGTCSGLLLAVELRDCATPLRLLLENGAFNVAADNNLLTARVLLKHGAELGATNRQGRTAVFILVAAEYGHAAAIELMATAGLDINLADNSGMTPLMTAAEYKHEAAVEMLLTHGAAVNAADNGGLTPLIAAAR